MERPSKHPRISGDARDSLRGLTRLGKISNKGLDELLSRLRNNPELLTVHRRQLADGFHERFEEVRARILLAMVEGPEWSWDIADPGLLLSKLLAERQPLRDLFVRILREKPCTREAPWSIVVGFDEFSPGNKLKVNNQRKCMVLSFSFSELGCENLSSDAVWFTPVVVRHNVIDKVRGGWAHMLLTFLELLLRGTHGLQTVGVAIPTGDGQIVMLFGKLTDLFSDGDGLRAALDWKGASGLKPCFRHWNVVSKNSDMVGRDVANEYVDICCADPRRFRLWAPGEQEVTIDMLCEGKRRVEAGTWTQARLDNLEKGCGFRANEHGLMANVEIRELFWAGDVSMFDWMHSALQNGTITDEVYLYSKACKNVGHSSREIEAFLRSGWATPTANKSSGKDLARVFDDWRSTSSDRANRLKASASELLGVYGLVRHWASVHVGERADLARERDSFEAGCAVVDLILQTKWGIISPQRASGLLLAACHRHMRAHVLAYGTTHIKPKHHWLFDFAEQLSSKRCILDAFIIERLHLRVKRHLDPVSELGVIEKSTLAGVVNEQFEAASKLHGDGLRGKPVLYEGSWVADHMVVGALRISSDDVICLGSHAGVVVACADEGGVLHCIVQEFEFISKVVLF